ncbi:MAG: hypothetical protein IIV24_08280, partial [Alistipes sp.]|nr:hypothetical protein [Alistipes sp.]
MQNSKCRIISAKELSCFALFEISCYICGLEITSISAMKKLFLLLALLSFIFTACDSGLDNEEN